MEKTKTPISDFDYLINEGNSSGIDQTPTQTKLDEEKGTTKSPENKRVIIAPELYPIFLFFLTKTYQNSIYFTLYFLHDYYKLIFTKETDYINGFFWGIIISGFSLTTVSLLLLKKCYQQIGHYTNKIHFIRFLCKKRGIMSTGGRRYTSIKKAQNR